MASIMDNDESKVIELLEHRAKCISTIEDKWISEWAALIEKYYKHETRNAVRLKALASLSQIFSKYHVICEDELMNKVILPNFADAHQETDTVVRKPIVYLLFDIATSCLSYKHCNAILAIVRKILTKPFNQRNEITNGLVYIIGNTDIIDSRLTITNLNKLFKTKLFCLPIDPAVNMLDILVNYLNLTYNRPLQGPPPAEMPMIRRELFMLLLNLRCNKYGHLGISSSVNQNPDETKFSPFIICVKRPKTPSDQSPSPAPDSPTQMNFHLQTGNTTYMAGSQSASLSTQMTLNHVNHLYQNLSHPNIFVSNTSKPDCPLESRCVNLEAMFAGIIECVIQETDLDVLKLVLDGLPSLLGNKPLVLTASEERINHLCIALSDLVRNNKLSGGQNSRIDVVKYGLRSLTSLLVYKRVLDHKSIKALLAAFEDSLKVSKYPVVPLFTTCLIELQDSSEMTKFIPVVLNRLSKFSPTQNLGISMLEFLSYLILFPKLYENFSEDEYKFIFAIALPYTNPFRFSDYVTCLAFRVVATWYLNCRPTLRYTFVEFVKKSLQSNVIQPFKENPPSTPLYSQASSPIMQTPPVTHSCPATMSPVDQRKRSSSLNTENSFRAQQAALGLVSPPLQINEELIQTFADLLCRYTHGQYLATAPKNRCTEFLLDRATSQTWVIGNSLVTTTSGRSGWNEIMIRRPTGNTSWIGRLQNTVSPLPMLNEQVYSDSLNFGNDIISLFSSMSPFYDEPKLDRSELSTSSSVSSSTTVLSGPPANTVGSNVGIWCTKNSDPIPLPRDKKFDIALSNLDHITPYETHKVGIVYVGRGQVDNRAKILSNRFGSPRYHEFLQKIGTCIVLNDIDPEVYFIGGLDVNGDDGKYTYFWKDNITQVIFHVATLMLARDNDPQCNNKNRHIGNDHVCIVYNDSEEPFNLVTIKGTGQLIKACITVSPQENDTNLIEVQVLPDLRNILGDFEPKVLSNLGAPLYARQLAIHLNLASKIYERSNFESYCSKEPYVSNWIERLRCIKRIRQRLEDSRKPANSNSMPRSGLAHK